MNDGHASFAFHPVSDADWARASRSNAGYTLSQFHPELNPQGVLPKVTFNVPSSPNFTFDNRLAEKGEAWLFSVRNDLTWLRGSHSFKAGMYFERLRNSEGRGGVGFFVIEEGEADVTIRGEETGEEQLNWFYTISVCNDVYVVSHVNTANRAQHPAVGLGHQLAIQHTAQDDVAIPLVVGTEVDVRHAGQPKSALEGWPAGYATAEWPRSAVGLVR